MPIWGSLILWKRPSAMSLLSRLVRAMDLMLVSDLAADMLCKSK